MISIWAKEQSSAEIAFKLQQVLKGKLGQKKE